MHQPDDRLKSIACRDRLRLRRRVIWLDAVQNVAIVPALKYIFQNHTPKLDTGWAGRKHNFGRFVLLGSMVLIWQ